MVECCYSKSDCSDRIVPALTKVVHADVVGGGLVGYSRAAWGVCGASHYYSMELWRFPRPKESAHNQGGSRGAPPTGSGFHELVGSLKPASAAMESIPLNHGSTGDHGEARNIF